MDICWDELRCKEIIRITDGCRLGYPGNFEADLDTGQIHALIIPGKRRFFGLFGRDADQRIPWNLIHRFGDDIILVGELPRPKIKETN